MTQSIETAVTHHELTRSRRAHTSATASDAGSATIQTM